MVGGRVERGSRRRSRAASVVVPFPRTRAGDRLDLARLVPSGRSLLVGFGLVAAVLAAAWVARASSVFAVERVEVVGAPPEVARQVESVADDVLGRSLLEVDARRVEDAVRGLPSIAGVSVDRSFPHALVIRVAAERPVAVVRKRTSSWLATGSGKVIREIETGSHESLPRLWLPKGVGVRVGGSLPASFVTATRTLEAVSKAGIPRAVKGVRSTDRELTLVLRNGPEIRLGEPRDVRLKLAVAAQVFRFLPTDAVYLDVSVPERPVTSRYNLNS
jgi:cell division protein FtsQ